MARRGPNPLIFAILILPYGAAYGFVAFALPPIAVRHGVAESAIADVIALTFIVHSIKPLWAPIVDTTLTRKRWYAIGLALTILGIVGAASMPVSPAALRALTAVVMAAQIGVTLLGMACESFLALTVPDDEKGRAAGWYMAGNFAGVGVGGWAALKLTTAFQTGWIVGAILGAAMIVCALPLFALPTPAPSVDHPKNVGAAFRQLGRDLVSLVTTRVGLTGLIIAISPVGAAAVQNLFNAVAPRWGVDAQFRTQILGWTMNADDVLGLVNGLVGGLVGAVGSMIGGWLADRMPRRLAYAMAGGLTAVASIAMALGPRTPGALVAFMMIYSVFAGIAFAAFSGFVLETIGTGAVATKYNIFAGAANLAIAYMTHLDGVGLDRWGTRGMLLTDAVCTGAGITLLLAIVLLLRPRPVAAT